MMFTTAAWVLAFLLLAAVFSKILDGQHNPNQSVNTLDTGEFREIVLKRSRNGHYLFDGEANRKKVTFLVDTGATMTAVPGKMQQELGLQAGPAMSVSTANGVADARLTKFDQLAIGGIEMYDVDATLIDDMAIDEILLGMNVLRHFELIQRNDELIIRQYR